MIKIKITFEHQGETLEQTQDFDEPFEEVQIKWWIQDNYPQGVLVSFTQL
jgi:hypothetical protein